MKLAWLVVLAACSSTDDTTPYVPTERAPLGMNDISILVPLPATSATPVLAKLDGMVPASLFERLVAAPGDVIETFDEFQLVAIRFDLCDRTEPGVCDASADGRLRLVFQPLIDNAGRATSMDVALHAFYAIPNRELGPLVDDLRRLAAQRGTTGPLDVAVLDAVTDRDALRMLVMRYAGEAKLLRLTLFAQHALTAAINWGFRGEERARTSDTFKPITIANVGEREQRTILTGADTTYSTKPVADAPAGFVRAIDSIAFGAASPADRMQALEAMAEIQNPMSHGADTAQCVACHVTTFLTARRTQLAGVDPVAIRGRYTSRYDLSVRGMATTTNRSLRAFGYLLTDPMISQRVVNDTAQVLVEIDERFPPAP